MDYAALAKQFGGTTAASAGTPTQAPSAAPTGQNGPQGAPSVGQPAPKVDYSALATQYGGKTKPAPVGFVQGAIRAIASPFLRAGANLATLSDINNPTELKKDQQEGVSYGDYLGKFRPIGSPVSTTGEDLTKSAGGFGKMVTDTVGTGAEAAANIVGGGEAVDVAKAGLKGALKQAVVKGLKVGSATGALAGGGSAAQAPDATTGSVVGSTIAGGIIGAPLGAAAEVAGPLIGAGKSKAADIIAGRTPEGKAATAAVNAEKLVGAITQGTKEDIPAVMNTLKQVDLSGVKTYQDAAKAVNDHISAVANGLDKALETNPYQKVTSELAHTTKIGGQDVTHNYVNDAMSQLRNFYEKTNDVAGITKIDQLAQKGAKDGLTVKEVNDLARLHGQDLNGYNANGELASGLTKQAAENTRQGLKATARDQFNNPIYEQSDKVMTDLIKTRGLFQDLADKAQAAQQKIKEASLPQKVGSLLEKALNIGTLGTSRGALKAAGTAMGIKGGETMTALDLQKALQKNIAKLDSIFGEDVSKGEMVSRLNKFLTSEKDAAGNRLALPAPKNAPLYVTPGGKASTVAQEAGDVAAVEQGRAKTSLGKTPPRADTSSFYGDTQKDIQVGKPGKSAKSNLPVIDAGKAKPPAKPGDIQLNKANAPKVFSPKKQGGYISLSKLAAGAGLGAAGVAASTPNRFSVTNSDQKTEAQPATNLDPQDKNILAATVFGELSNKGDTAAEARKIINTVINRTKQTGGSIRDIITAPNQYQAYGKEQFMKAVQGKLDPLSQKKMSVVNTAIDELYSGKLKDNTNGSVFYEHDKSGNLKLKSGTLKK